MNVCFKSKIKFISASTIFAYTWISKIKAILKAFVNIQVKFLLNT